MAFSLQINAFRPHTACTFEENETGVQRNEVLESFLDAPCPAAVLHLDLDSGGNVTDYNSLMNS